MAEPNIDRLDQRVTGLEHGQKDLSTSLVHLSTRIDDKFNTLGTLVQERSRTQWPLLYSAAGLVISVMTIIGFLAMKPTDNKIADHDDFLKELRVSLVSRQEHVERWKSYDKDIDNLRSRLIYETTNIDKNIEDLRKKFNDTYGARDIILDLKDRIGRLEAEAPKK
jgi:hypothetical protein